MLQCNLQYRCIGRGFCGSVWTPGNPPNNDDGQVAIKREDGGPGRSVTNDYNMHLRVLQSAIQQPPLMPLSIPYCHNLVQPDDTWWLSNLHQFPSGYIACRALISERIPKIPRPISNKIVDLFCAGNAQLSTFVKGNPDDDACLIRPYLGRRRRHRQEGKSESRFQRFSLRNVPLHIDQMEALDLCAGLYAETMAEALALMHWGAEIDANDVEFVLAPPRSKHTQSMAFQSDYLGTHCMWILDFDCCRPMRMDAEGVEQACAAFFRNDPFYPRPGTGETADEELWVVFKQRFLKSSYRFLGGARQHIWYLADRLMHRIEEDARSRSSDRDSRPSQ